MKSRRTANVIAACHAVALFGISAQQAGESLRQLGASLNTFQELRKQRSSKRRAIGKDFQYNPWRR